jgi:hypothetical protein
LTSRALLLTCILTSVKVGAGGGDKCRLLSCPRRRRSRPRRARALASGTASSGSPSGPAAPPSAAARHLEDARLRALAQAAASDESAARGRNISLLLALGLVGAAGLAARPLYRAAFAERAAVEAAIQRAARAARREEGAERLQVLLARLEALERAHQRRAPYAALLERAAAEEGADGGAAAAAAAAAVGGGGGGGSGGADAAEAARGREALR